MADHEARHSVLECASGQGGKLAAPPTMQTARLPVPGSFTDMALTQDGVRLRLVRAERLDVLRSAQIHCRSTHVCASIPWCPPSPLWEGAIQRSPRPRCGEALLQRAACVPGWRRCGCAPCQVHRAHVRGQRLTSTASEPQVCSGRCLPHTAARRYRYPVPLGLAWAGLGCPNGVGT